VSELRLYIDENVPTEVGRQLRSSGIDAVTARDLGSLGAGDRDHLERVTAQSRMLSTHDQDFLRLAAAGGHRTATTTGGRHDLRRAWRLVPGYKPNRPRGDGRPAAGVFLDLRPPTRIIDAGEGPTDEAPIFHRRVCESEGRARPGPPRP